MWRKRPYMSQQVDQFRAYAHPMTDESPGVTPDDDALRGLLDRPLTELTPDELVALMGGYAAAGESLSHHDSSVALDLWVLTGTAVYFKAFLETLAKHNAEALIDAVRTRIRKNGKTREALVGPEDGSAATLVVTSKTPDEARLAVLDLDVTAEEVRGKVLRWDDDAMAWRAKSADD